HKNGNSIAVSVLCIIGHLRPRMEYRHERHWLTIIALDPGRVDGGARRTKVVWLVRRAWPARHSGLAGIDGAAPWQALGNHGGAIRVLRRPADVARIPVPPRLSRHYRFHGHGD